MEKISVIVPVYNAEGTIGRCLNSLIYQTYENLEIICINDGSTDESLRILEEYQKNANRIILINKRNQGVSEARNDGLRRATGSYLSFVDSDDWVHKDYFSTLMLVATKFNCDIVQCSFLQAKSELQISDVELELCQVLTISLDREAQLHNWDFKCVVWGKLFKRGCIKNIYFENLLHEDVFFMREVFVENKSLTVHVIEEKLYYYWRVTNAQSKSADLNIRFFQHAQQYFHKFKQRKNIIYLVDAKNCLLNYRFVVSKSKENLAQEFKSLRNSIVHEFVNSDVETIEKLKTCVFFYIPIIYKIFRTIVDK